MYEKFKNYINRYSWIWYIVMAGVACAICWIIYGGSSDNSSTVEHLERAQGEQRKSLELNQTVEDSVERSTQLNRQASERITRIEVYQQRASERIEQGHQAKPSNGRAPTPPTKHVGAD